MAAGTSVGVAAPLAGAAVHGHAYGILTAVAMAAVAVAVMAEFAGRRGRRRRPK